MLFKNNTPSKSVNNVIKVCQKLNYIVKLLSDNGQTTLN